MNDSENNNIVVKWNTAISWNDHGRRMIEYMNEKINYIYLFLLRFLTYNLTYLTYF